MKMKGGIKPLLVISVWLVAIACQKDITKEVLVPGGGSIYATLKANVNFSGSVNALELSGYSVPLSKPGSYSFFTTAAFQFYNGGDYLAPLADSYCSYLICSPAVALRSIPIGVDVPIKNIEGTFLYVHRYLNGRDTVTTVNGVPLEKVDFPASNGTFNIANSVLDSSFILPARSLTLRDLIFNSRGDAFLYGGGSALRLSYFAAAIQKEGLDKILANADSSFTVLAASDAAFNKAGYPNIDSIIHASSKDDSILTRILNYAIIPKKYNVYDLLHTYKGFTTDTIATRLGSNLYVIGSLDPSGKVFASFNYFDAHGNEATGYPGGYYQIESKDYYTGNGIVHIVDNLLKP